MNRDDIIRMAREAGFSILTKAGNPDQNPLSVMSVENLQAFANLVAAAEREACAKVCEDDCGNGALNLAFAIRERGAP